MTGRVGAERRGRATTSCSSRCSSSACLELVSSGRLDRSCLLTLEKISRYKSWPKLVPNGSPSTNLKVLWPSSCLSARKNRVEGVFHKKSVREIVLMADENDFELLFH